MSPAATFEGRWGEFEHAGGEFVELEVARQRLAPEEVVVERLVAVDAFARVECEQPVEEFETCRVFDVVAQALFYSAP